MLITQDTALRGKKTDIPMKANADKYQAAVVNSYFDVLIQYGDQYEKLGYDDLIEVKVRGERDLDVRLRNPEYDLTRAIKKVLYGYQGGGDPFAGIGEPIRFRGFVSPDAVLPEPLPALRVDLEAVLGELAALLGIEGEPVYSSLARWPRTRFHRTSKIAKVSTRWGSSNTLTDYDEHAKTDTR